MSTLSATAIETGGELLAAATSGTKTSGSDGGIRSISLTQARPVGPHSSCRYRMAAELLRVSDNTQAVETLPRSAYPAGRMCFVR